MSRFLKSRVSVVALLLSILVLVIGISAARGSDSPQGASSVGAAHTSEAPTIVAAPIRVVVEDCNGTAEFTVFGSGWDSTEVIVTSLIFGDGSRKFIGSGFPNDAGAYSDDVSVFVSSCAVLSVKSKSTGGHTANTPVAIVAEK